MAKKHEIYATSFGSQLFKDYFYRAEDGPLAPPDSLLNIVLLSSPPKTSVSLLTDWYFGKKQP